jgi:hypothetical protein
MNGTIPHVSTAELEQLRADRDAAALRLEINQLRAAAGQPQPLLEDWGQIVDRSEFLYDVPGWYTSTLVPAVPFTTLSDREDGRFRPFYYTEIDLQYSRAKARNLALRTGVKDGAIDAIGTRFAESCVSLIR